MVAELPYSLHDRYASIATAWTVIVTPPVFLNLGLFYGLWYGRPDLDRLLGMIFFAPTPCLGPRMLIHCSSDPSNGRPGNIYRHRYY